MACSCVFSIISTIITIGFTAVIISLWAPWSEYTYTVDTSHTVRATDMAIRPVIRSFSKPIGSKQSYVITKTIYRGLLFVENMGGTIPVKSREFTQDMNYELISLVLVGTACFFLAISLFCACGVCCNCCKNKGPAFAILASSTVAALLLIAAVSLYGALMVSGEPYYKSSKLSWGFFMTAVAGMLVLIIPLLGGIAIQTEGDLVDYTDPYEQYSGRALKALAPDQLFFGPNSSWLAQNMHYLQALHSKSEGGSDEGGIADSEDPFLDETGECGDTPTPTAIHEITVRPREVSPEHMKLAERKSLEEYSASTRTSTIV